MIKKRKQQMCHVTLAFIEMEFKTDYTIIFKGCNAHMGEEFEIEYTGADLIFRSWNMGLTDKQEEKLKDILNEQYGYGPFDKEEVKKEFESNNRYRL